MTSLCVYLCIDSAAGGEIFDHCVSEELLPEAQITRLMRQTLEGVHHLHQSNLVHLDLKVRAHTHTHTENHMHECSWSRGNLFLHVHSLHRELPP